MYGCMPMIVHGPKVSAEFPQYLDYNDLYIYRCTYGVRKAILKEPGIVVMDGGLPRLLWSALLL